VGFSGSGESADFHVQFFAQMLEFGVAAGPQLFLLKKKKKHL
jgi:hypothetical protein